MPIWSVGLKTSVTVVPGPTPPAVPGPTPSVVLGMTPAEMINGGKANNVWLSKQDAIGGGFTQVLSGINDLSLKYAIQRDVNNLLGSCNASIANFAENGTDKCLDPSSIGIIIHLVIAIYPAPIGQPPINQLWTIFQGDMGANAEATLSAYLKKDIIGGYMPVPGNATEKWFLLWYQYDAPSLGGGLWLAP